MQITGNIRAHPDEPKYRTLKASNKALQGKVFAVRGGRELFRLVRAAGAAAQWIIKGAR